MTTAESGSHPSRVADTTWGRALAILAVVVFVVLSMAGPGQTFCIGADAHFAVESAGSACCAPAARPPATPDRDAGSPPTVDPCHDPSSDDGCTDLRLGIDPHHGASQRHAQVATAPAATTGGSGPAPAVCDLPGVPRAAWPLAAGPPPVVRRTLVLRC